MIFEIRLSFWPTSFQRFMKYGYATVSLGSFLSLSWRVDVTQVVTFLWKKKRSNNLEALMGSTVGEYGYLVPH